MAIYELNATIRQETGKGAAHRARRAGTIPAIAYGYEVTPPVTLSLNDVEFRDFIHRHNATTALLRLKMAGEGDVALSGKVFIIKDMQLHHIERNPLAVDLLSIDLTRPVTVTVPLVFTGISKGIKMGGLVTPLVREVHVSCLPEKIPTTLHCDVTELAEGTTWYLRELKVPESVALALPPDTPMVACVIPRQTTPEEEEAAKAAEAAAAEGAAAEGAEAKPKAEGKAEGKGEGKGEGKK
jgi:large subunit ribosomal protein L25